MKFYYAKVGESDLVEVDYEKILGVVQELQLQQGVDEVKVYESDASDEDILSILPHDWRTRVACANTEEFSTSSIDEIPPSIILGHAARLIQEAERPKVEKAQSSKLLGEARNLILRVKEWELKYEGNDEDEEDEEEDE